MKIVYLFIIITSISYGTSLQEKEAIINGILKDSKIKEDNKTTKKPIQNEEKKDTSSPISNSKKAIMISTDDQIQLKSGIEQYNNRMFDEAIKTMSILQEKYPSSNFVDTSFIYSGKAYMGNHNYTKSIEQFKKIKPTSGEYPLSLFKQAFCYKALGQEIDSIKLYQKTYSLFPSHELADDSMLQTAKLHLKNKRPESAVSTIIKIIRKYKDRETIDDAYFLLGIIYQTDSKLRDSETALKVYTIFLNKARNKKNYFKNSPLLSRVKKEIKKIRRENE